MTELPFNIQSWKGSWLHYTAPPRLLSCFLHWMCCLTDWRLMKSPYGNTWFTYKFCYSGRTHSSVSDRWMGRCADDFQCCRVNCSVNNSTVRHDVESSITPVCPSGSLVYLNCSVLVHTESPPPLLFHTHAPTQSVFYFIFLFTDILQPELNYRSCLLRTFTEQHLQPCIQCRGSLVGCQPLQSVCLSLFLYVVMSPCEMIENCS